MSTQARRRYRSRFAPYRARTIGAIVLSILQAALLIPLPILIGRSIDQALPDEDTGQLVAIAAAMVLLAAGSVATADRRSCHRPAGHDARQPSAPP